MKREAKLVELAGRTLYLTSPSLDNPKPYPTQTRALLSQQPNDGAQRQVSRARLAWNIRGVAMSGKCILPLKNLRSKYHLESARRN